MASFTILNLWVEPARSSVFKGGILEGRKITLLRSNLSLTSSATLRWPKCIGLKVPPNRAVLSSRAMDNLFRVPLSCVLYAPCNCGSNLAINRVCV